MSNGKVTTVAPVAGEPYAVTKTTTVVAHQQAPEWSDGLCACCSDMGICCQSICCGPCTASNIITKRDTGEPNCDCLTCCCFLLLSSATGNRFQYWLSTALRRELVQRYSIANESACNSCCMTACCQPCVFCQIQREMAARHEHAGGCCSKPPPDEPRMSANVLAQQMMSGKGVVHWGSGICDCGCMECCEVIFCGCCIHGYMYSLLELPRAYGQPVAHEQKVNCPACFGALLCPDVFNYANRREIIERYGVQDETHIRSACLTLFCPCCTLLQQRREMAYNSEWPGGVCVKEAPPRRDPR
jgi:Cys-rich protein (TIGR01571 family)